MILKETKTCLVLEWNKEVSSGTSYFR